MNPRDYGELASRLAAKADATPAELRTATSRAYYALYNVAVLFLEKMRVKIPKGGEAHKLVGEALRHCGDDNVAKAARDMDDLRMARWAADYEMADTVAEDQRRVQKSAARAKQAIKKLDECEANPTRFMEARIKVRNWAGSADGAGKGFTLS